MKNDNDSFFVDANVLVYAAVEGDHRHEVAKALLKNPNLGTLHISPQIVTEFYSTVSLRATKKLLNLSKRFSDTNTLLCCLSRTTFPVVCSPYSRPTK
jgi:predicted nucleic acid-binding protein